MRNIKILLIFLIIVLLAGCNTKTLPPIKKYTIDDKIDIAIATDKIPECKNIKISFPQSSNEIFSKNIIYQKGLQKNSYYFSKWYETPNEMLYKLVLFSLQKKEICKMILPEDISISTQYDLNSNILDFSQKFINKQSYGEVKILFYVKNSKGDLIAQKLFDEIVKCKSKDAKGGVGALNKASKKITLSLIGWLENIVKHPIKGNTNQ